jgi:hypothetical protein
MARTRLLLTALVWSFLRLCRPGRNRRRSNCTVRASRVVPVPSRADLRQVPGCELRPDLIGERLVRAHGRPDDLELPLHLSAAGQQRCVGVTAMSA